MVSVDVYPPSKSLDKNESGRKSVKPVVLKRDGEKDVFTGNPITAETSIASHIVPCSSLICAIETKLTGKKRKNRTKITNNLKKSSLAKAIAAEKEVPDALLKEIEMKDPKFFGKMCPYHPKGIITLDVDNDQYFNDYSMMVSDDGIIHIAEEAKQAGCTRPLWQY